jgi:uncharacterized protein (DUF1501 family)
MAMNKSRRNFLKKLPLAMSLPFTIGGLPFKAMGENMLSKMARMAKNDKVLVILQMHGGNDGLNCLVPISKYAEYFNGRPNIAIPTPNKTRGYINLDSTLPDLSQVGLHPDMQAMKHLYDVGQMTVVQGVSYPNNNGSHFRGRDIWFMGGGANDYMDSGWLGRYLAGEYAGVDNLKYPDDFPNATMEDPLALEIGNDTSLIFHQHDSIPTSISLYSIPGFSDLVLNELEGFEDELLGVLDNRGVPPTGLNGTPYQKEMDWILSLEDKSRDYADILLKRYNDGKAPTVTYPDLYPYNAPTGSLHNPLSHQLKMVARLLAGKCKTKVFLVKIGGFDTHADQVEKYDPTMGGHAALMYHISTAMAAFQKDLKARGLDNDVLTVTTSEFGRRVSSNASYGTDHGTAGPLFIFGKGAKGGVIGDAYELDGGNLKMQVDYRNVYANILRDWFEVDDAQLNIIFPDASAAAPVGQGLMNNGTSDGITFVALPLASTEILGTEEFINERYALKGCYPNPARDKTTVLFRVNAAYNVTIDLYDVNGRRVKEMVNGFFTPGDHQVEVDLTGVLPGNYIYELKTGSYKKALKLVIKK